MTPQPPASADIGALLAWLRRRWLLIAFGTFAGLSLGIIALAVLPKAYEATTAVLVRPIAIASESDGSLNMDTELQLVQSATVAQRAAEDLGRPDAAGAVLQRLSLFVPPNSTVIEITYEGLTSESAQAGAEAVGSAYLSVREDAALQQIDQRIAGLAAQRDSLAARASELRSQIAEVEEGSNAEQQLLVDLDSTLRRIADLDTQIAGLETASVTPGIVITEPEAPRRPSSPGPIVLVASTVMVGLLLGLALAIASDAVAARRVQSLSRLKRFEDLRVAVELRGWELTAAASKDADVVRKFGLLLSSAASHGEASRGLFLVTAATRNPAKGNVAARLAEMAARARGSALVVVQDPSSSLAKLTPDVQFVGQLPNDPTDDEQASTLGRARLLSTISDKPDAAPGAWDVALMSSLQTAAESQLVVLDVPAMDESGDAYMLSAHVDAIVLVVGQGQATSVVSDAVSHLRMSSAAPILGVLVDEDRPGSRVRRRRKRESRRRLDLSEAPRTESRSG